MFSRQLMCVTLLMFGLVQPNTRAQENAVTDDALTKNLLSGPGPTFTVSAKDIPPHWSLIAYGDMRFTDPSNESVTNPYARRALVARIASEHPDAVMLSGDVPYDGANVDDYAVFHSETACMARAAPASLSGAWQP